jgi:hypothetical protein
MGNSRRRRTNVQILFSKTDTHHQSNNSDKQRLPISQPRRGKRPAPWSPQPSGLTRDETRQLVLDIIG